MHREVRPIKSDEAFITLRDGTIELSDKPSDDAVLVARRRVFRGYAPLTARQIQVSKLKYEHQTVTTYYAGVLVPEDNKCRIKNEISVLTLQPLPIAMDRLFTSSIKERDYDHRGIVLPSDVETVLVEGDRELHGLGEITFETQIGPFQIVPNSVADIGEILHCDNS